MSKSSVQLDIDQKASMFRLLASSSLYDVGIKFELDKYYKDVRGVKNKVYTVYKEVCNDPEKFSVHPDTIELVMNAVSNRSISVGMNSTVPTMRETQSAIKETDIKNLTISGRDRAGRLINQKLEYIENHPKALANESLVTLGKIFGILFDKAQIIQGQATEHVALMGKIDSNMSPDEAISAVLKYREIIQAEKYG